MAKRRKKQSDSFTKVLTVITLIIAVILVLHDKGVITIPFLNQDEQEIEFVADGNAKVHFINVGQGDCELIISDDGKTMLIDSGEAEYGATVVNYLKNLGINHLDYVIATHPHSDHIGGLSTVILSDITVGRIIVPRINDEFVPTTRTYEGFLDSVADKGYKLSAAKTETFEFGKGTISIYMTDYDGDNLNNYSVVTRFDFGNSSFLFTGDMEAQTEKTLIMVGHDVNVDVLKVGHHGSNTSSCEEFLNVVTPDYCVIECGDNSYNHPHSDTVKRLKGYTDIILRTDINGDVVFTTDGNVIEYITEK
ncbi:MAG: MBL fold metallo-hydrolase [Oscillospiraceae bacterium]|nr:MBL fold metallo-hydrolase [Oscillospiraceae bacterium]